MFCGNSRRICRIGRPSASNDYLRPHTLPLATFCKTGTVDRRHRPGQARGQFAGQDFLSRPWNKIEARQFRMVVNSMCGAFTRDYGHCGGSYSGSFTDAGVGRDCTRDLIP
jgi:hypothetical protein